MKKQNKKTLQTTAKKQNKKAVANIQPTKTEKAPAQKAVDFKTALRDTGDLQKALKLSKKQRAEYLQKLMETSKAELESISQRLGVGKCSDLNPLKADYTKIETIRGNNKGYTHSITARMVYGLILCYLNRDTDSGFSRIFPTGLYLDKGLLNRLYNSDYIKSKGGENEKQTFTFTDKCKHIITDKQLLNLEKTAIEGGLL